MAAKPKRMVGLDYTLLPPEIWTEILGRVPVKSILRYRSVCKSWYSLVSCPDFISHHSITNQHDKNGYRVLLQLEPDVKSRARSFISHDMDIESREHNDEYVPDRLISPKNHLEIVGSCNGLICLADYGQDYAFSVVTYSIWNPAIRKIVELPSLKYNCDAHLSCVGFGFDSNTSDYKVMCNLCFHRGFEVIILTNACQIIDLNKGVWRSISPLLPSQIYKLPEAECYVNGAVHWSHVSDRILLSFDMSDECFREMRMPDCAEFTLNDDDDHHRRVKTYCVAIGGLVNMIVWKKKRDDYAADVSESCSLWAMKEYGVPESWIKVSNIDLSSVQVLPSIKLLPETFIFLAKHEILMVHSHPVDEGNKDDLVLYNNESKKSKRLLSTTKRIENRCLYKESLVLM